MLILKVHIRMIKAKAYQIFKWIQFECLFLSNEVLINNVCIISGAPILRIL